MSGARPSGCSSTGCNWMPSGSWATSRGVAMALAGLGRLEWYARTEERRRRREALPAEPGNLRSDRRRHRPGQDAQLARGLRLEKDDLEQAVAHYQRSWELAGDPLDRCFAGRRLAALLPAAESPRSIRGDGATTLWACSSARRLPFDCESQLQAVLEACPVASRSEAVRRLWDLTQH